MADKSIAVLVGGLGLCGAACLLAPGALAITATAALGTVGAALAPNIAADLYLRLADWSGKKLRDKGAAAKNHDLRELVAMSIENVLDEVITSRPGSSEGVTLLRKYRAATRSRLRIAAVDPRFKGTWEQTVPHYFKTRIEDFSTAKALTPDIWKQFLNEVAYADLNSNEQAALEAAAAALHTQLPKYLVGAYRDALEHHPTVYVAVQTALLQELWIGISRVDSKVESLNATQSEVLAQLGAIKEAIRSAYPVEFVEALDELRVLISTVEWLTREVHGDIKNIKESSQQILNCLSSTTHDRQAEAFILGWLAIKAVIPGEPRSIIDRMARLLSSLSITVSQPVEFYFSIDDEGSGAQNFRVEVSNQLKDRPRCALAFVGAGNILIAAAPRPHGSIGVSEHRSLQSAADMLDLPEGLRACPPSEAWEWAHRILRHFESKVFASTSVFALEE